MARISVSVQDSNNIIANVIPTPNNIIQLNRGIVGPQGPAGPATNDIGGYPVVIAGAQNYDALMWFEGEWVNVPQVEITDGGNF